MAKPKVLALIPARYKSQRLPGKAILDVEGKPLIQWVYERTLACDFIDEVYVLTDHNSIAKAVQKFQGQVLMTPEECPSGSDRICWALNKYKDVLSGDLILNIQGDVPDFDEAGIKKLIDALSQDEEAVVSTPVILCKDPEAIEDPNVVKCVFDKKNHALYFSRYPIPYKRSDLEVDREKEVYIHAGIYAYKTEFIKRFDQLTATPCQELESLEQLKILEWGHKIHVVPVDAFPVIDVNTSKDLDAFKAFAANKRESKGTASE